MTENERIMREKLDTQPRNEILEECAKICEAVAKGYPEPYSRMCDAILCANNIRAMKK